MSRLSTKKTRSLNNTRSITETMALFVPVLRLHSEKVSSHCKRVGLLSKKTAEILGKDKKAAFCAGMLHDFGKIFIRKELFSGEDITDQEYEEVKEHALKGYLSLKNRHLFTALCCGLHHAMGKNGYGLKSENLPHKMKPNTLKKALDIAAIVSICDFIDAFCTRKTKIKGDVNNVKKISLEKLLLEKFPEDKIVIDAALKARKQV